MTEFFNVLPPKEALDTLFDHLPAVVPTTTTVDTETALGLVTTAAITAPSDLPAFPRSTMDGYAVRAKDTFGASQTLPSYLTVVGEVQMGCVPDIQLNAGQTTLVHTGGMLPDTADAVVMVEHTQASREAEIEVLKPVAVGENVLKFGEDVQRDTTVFHAGQVLRPQDLGALMALGITSINVRRPPTVGIIATGDEVISPDSATAPGQVRDINSYTVSALVERAGGIPKRYGIIQDSLDALRTLVATMLVECDVAVISAGSSVSVRDITSEVINRLGEPGVLVHGVAVKPGKPTILAAAQGKPVFGLPGNPVSALVTADIFLVPTVYRLQGAELPDPRVSRARLTHNIASTAGREDYVPGRFVLAPSHHHQSRINIQEEQWIEPIFGKSNLIFTLVRADGAIMVPLNMNGISQGEMVNVRLF